MGQGRGLYISSAESELGEIGPLLPLDKILGD